MCKVYSMELDPERHPVLVAEKDLEYNTDKASSPEIVFKTFEEAFRLSHLAEENLCLLALDAKSQPLGLFRVFIGTACSAFCNPREIFIRALVVGATQMIVLHNHPSGDPSPSPEDFNCMNKLRELGKVMDVKLVDFLIVGDGAYYSAAESSEL